MKLTFDLIVNGCIRREMKSIRRRTIKQQSKRKLSHFFGRSSSTNKSNGLEDSFPQTNLNNSSLKLRKSLRKLEGQNPDQQLLTNRNNESSILIIPSKRSRSHESLFVSNGCVNDSLGSILSAKTVEIMLDNCHVHPTIVQSSNLNNAYPTSSYEYIQISNKLDKKKCYLCSKKVLNANDLLLNDLGDQSLEKRNADLRTDNCLDISILEAKGFPNKKKYYVQIYVDDHIYGKTTSKERQDILFWGEYFTFKHLPQGCSTLRCQICREICRRKQKENDLNDMDLIGYVNISLSTINENQFIEQWYTLQIPSTKDKSIKYQQNLFHIRIKYKYQTIQILPNKFYLHLQQYLQRNYLRIIGILQPHISLRDKDQIATSLTRIAQSLSYSTQYLVDIIEAEILSTPDNTLTFRGNSIATKSMESYMKLIGSRYLRETLRRFIIDIISSKNVNDIDLEVDPDRLKNNPNLERNQIRLRLLCEQIWSQIHQSHQLFPQELKLIFSQLRQFSLSDERIFHLISGSVFLRFLCPAILSPNLFDLTQEYPTEKASRKLTLIAKTLQTLANFSKFGPKECYMKFLNDFVSKESDNMRRFLSNISTIDNKNCNSREINEFDVKCLIDLGREYSIIHVTLVELFQDLDLNIRQSLNELDEILNDLSNIKLFYFSSKITPQIHLHHHHHHHIYHHSKFSNDYINSNRCSLSDSQLSLSLIPREKANPSSQGYYSISRSSTITNIENINEEILPKPLAFTNPLYHHNEQLYLPNDLSDHHNDEQYSNHFQRDSSNSHCFVNNLCTQLSNHSSPQHQPFVHSSFQQQPLFVLNNCYLKENGQSFSSSNMDRPLATFHSTTQSRKADQEFANSHRRQQLLSSEQFPPKMGVKALNHIPKTKESIHSHRSPILNLYEEEKCRRMESEKQTERLGMELNRLNEELKEYKEFLSLINNPSIRRTSVDDLNYSDCYDDDSKPIENEFCLNNNPESEFPI